MPTAYGVEKIKWNSWRSSWCTVHARNPDVLWQSPFWLEHSMDGKVMENTLGTRSEGP